MPSAFAVRVTVIREVPSSSAICWKECFASRYWARSQSGSTMPGYWLAARIGMPALRTAAVTVRRCRLFSSAIWCRGFPAARYSCSRNSRVSSASARVRVV